MKINNYFVGFGGILILLLTGHLLVIFKYFQPFFHHAIYFCQEMIKLVSFQLSGNFGKTVFWSLILVSSFILTRLTTLIFKIYSFRRSLMKTRVTKEINIIWLLDKLNLRKKVEIIVQKKPQAFCFGVFSPKIYISTGLLKLVNHHELEVILKHEKYHLKNMDTLTMLLASLVESLFPFFPIFSDFTKIYRIDREVKADQFATYEKKDKKLLSIIFKKLLKYEPIMTPAFLPGIISADTFEARIRSLLSLKTTYKAISRKSLYLSLASMIVLAGLMATPIDSFVIYGKEHDLLETLCREQRVLKLQSTESPYSPVNFTSVN